MPYLWSNVAYPSLKPLASWVADLLSRVRFVRLWLEDGQPRVFDLPAFYFPQGFMTAVLQLHARKYKLAINTLRFTFQLLTQAEQTEALEWVRPEKSAAMDKKKVPTEETKADGSAEGDAAATDPEEAVATEEDKTGQVVHAAFNDGVLCSGLFLEGARIADTSGNLQLEDQLPRQLVSKMPVLHFLPEPNHVIQDEFYVCPVYKISTRQGVLSTTGMSTNFVVQIELPRGNQSSSYWILRGTAALLNLDT